MWVPDWDIDDCHDMWNEETYQWGLIDDVIRNFPNGRKGIAVDIGANVGYTARRLAKYFDKVYAFEPLESTFECLVKNTEHLTSVQNYNYAICDYVGSCLMKSGNVSGHSHLKRYDPPGLVAGRDRTAKVTTLYKLQIDNIDLIKIDAEGAEIDIIQFHRSLIIKNKPIMIVEAAVRQQETQNLMHSLAYVEMFVRNKDRIYVHKNRVREIFEKLPLTWGHIFV